MAMLACGGAQAAWKASDAAVAQTVVIPGGAGVYAPGHTVVAAARSQQTIIVPARDAVPSVVSPPGAPRVPTTTSGAAPGQAGYVHYFLVRKPDGVSEMQIGIELADQSIAWAFADGAVEIAPFIESGTRQVHGRSYRVEHLFGIRPFADDVAMAKLARDLPTRVMPWIEDGVQHCDVGPPPRAMCVSCLGFVLRVLFPAEFPLPPALPADFRQARLGERYTTEDLLLYLSGLHVVPTREAKLERIGELAMPASMREELVRLVTAEPAVDEARPSALKPRRSARVDGKAKAARSPAPRRL